MAKILVVEDEPGIALGLEDSLRLEGYEVEVVGDGTTATYRAQMQEFDLILLDVMLPWKSGFEVCRELRCAGVATPVIFLSARAMEPDRVLGLDLGENDYVTKPFSPRELMARVRALLRYTENIRRDRKTLRRGNSFGNRGASEPVSPDPAHRATHGLCRRMPSGPRRQRGLLRLHPARLGPGRFAAG